MLQDFADEVAPAIYFAKEKTWFSEESTLTLLKADPGKL